MRNWANHLQVNVGIRIDRLQNNTGSIFLIPPTPCSEDNMDFLAPYKCTVFTTVWFFAFFHPEERKKRKGEGKNEERKGWKKNYITKKKPSYK